MLPIVVPTTFINMICIYILCDNAKKGYDIGFINAKARYMLFLSNIYVSFLFSHSNIMDNQITESISMFIYQNLKLFNYTKVYDITKGILSFFVVSIVAYLLYSVIVKMIRKELCRNKFANKLNRILGSGIYLVKGLLICSITVSILSAVFTVQDTLKDTTNYLVSESNQQGELLKSYIKK